jgi:hypothetical protein
MMASSRVRLTRAEQSGAGFFMSEEECHDQESLPPAAVINPLCLRLQDWI